LKPTKQTKPRLKPKFRNQLRRLRKKQKLRSRRNKPPR
jgi:hypothetical protein